MVELTVIKGAPSGGQDLARVALVHGEPMRELPRDLYIPPEALEVFLETFEGPLDLLLYLIRKHNLDVLDIQMAEITRQYMDYVEVMRMNQLELAAEYLLMAALLIEIKSRMLLPTPPAPTTDESEDPRAELVRRLLEYERMKAAALTLAGLPQVGRDFQSVHVFAERAALVRMPEVDSEDLRIAWLGLLSRARASRHHRVTREQLSVREHMTRVLRHLQGLSFVEFGSLFDPNRGVPELVVTFLAILELAKERLVQVTQQAAFAPIYVTLNHGISTN